MSGFSFPPPPPPPPKASAINGQQTTPQRGGGDRGNFRSRGRGQPGGRGYGQLQRGRAQLYHNTHAGPPPSPAAPSSTYEYSDHVVPQSSPNLRQRPSWSNDQHSAESPSRTAAGHKRKLDALRGPPQKKPVKKPAPATAPAVPTFGALLMPVSPPAAKNNDAPAPHVQNSQKPSNRSLGLTPSTGDTQYSSSDNEEDGDELDEEAMHAELGDKLTFEHNGVVVSLNSQADLLAWKQDRRKKWPTKTRMATKHEERRKVGEERKRLLAGVGELYGNESRFSKPGSNIWTSAEATSEGGSQNAKNTLSFSMEQTSETSLEKTKREMAETTKRLEDLRRKVTESEARNRKAREQAEQRQNQSIDAAALSTEVGSDPGDDGEVASPAVDGSQHAEDECSRTEPLGESPTTEPSSESDPSSSSSDEDSDEEPPEEVTSKQVTNTPLNIDQRPFCRYFRASGWCRDGDACKFRHDVAEQQPRSAGQQQRREGQRQGHVRKDQHAPKLESKSDKKTIFQRLVEQEEAENDRLALKAVKYLGEAGFFR